MRVAYAGYDFFSPCLRLLVDRPDMDVCLCLTGGRDESVGTIVALADEAGAAVIHGRPGRHGWDLLRSAGVDLFVAAAYSYRVPISDLDLPIAVNVHPSLLPDGRGPNPLPYLVDEASESAGVTLHLMEDSFDSGPILLQEELAVGADWDLTSVTLATIGMAPSILGRFLDDAERFISSAQPQGDGSYWPVKPTDEYTIRLADVTVSEIAEVIRLFGGLSLEFILADGSALSVARAFCVQVDHGFAPGRVVGGAGKDILVTATDGLVRLVGSG